MVVTCHQPHFLPWVPYFNKLAHSDLFIVLDDVDFRKNYFQNRTIIVDKNNTQSWLTIPVRRPKLGTPISKVYIAKESNAFNVSINRFREAYKNFCDNEFYNSILNILENPPSKLIDLNMILLRLILKELHFDNLNIKMISSIVKRENRSERVLSALKRVGASKIIVGMGGMASAHNLSLWKNQGIDLSFQCPSDSHSECSLSIGSGISILHDIITFGSNDARKIAINYWAPE